MNWEEGLEQHSTVEPLETTSCTQESKKLSVQVPQGLTDVPLLWKVKVPTISPTQYIKAAAMTSNCLTRLSQTSNMAEAGCNAGPARENKVFGKHLQTFINMILKNRRNIYRNHQYFVRVGHCLING